MKKYYPIFVSKSGELRALKELSQKVKNEISPIIEVIPDNYKRVLNFAINEWTFNNNELYLDFSLCSPYDDQETQKLIESLILAQVNVVPVINKSSDSRQIDYIKKLLINSKISKICYRLYNGEFSSANIQQDIDSFIKKIGTNRKNLSILLDFGVVQHSNYLLYSKEAILLSKLLKQLDLNSIIVSSGSFPQNLSSLTPAGHLYSLQRYEWHFWLELQKVPELCGLIYYSDFGTKYPKYIEANYPGTCSIKYTTEFEFLIYRGELSKSHHLGNGQFIVFASKLITNQQYSGQNFSWGDGRIFSISTQLNSMQQTPGNLGTWVQISQNHHITITHSLL
ncbi:MULTISPECIES: beta family protein [Sphingobacterium]|uniref:beta family protein n=1 Tax=Sphingobacterium TaxID=28453 RepID=UPI0028A8BB62|nr:hypothetical protein [Sphingobacterium multivorum]